MGLGKRLRHDLLRLEAMADPFTGIRLKLSRALDEFKALDKEIASFINTKPHPYRPSVNFNVTTRVLTLRVHIEKAPNPIWGIRIGEVIHNLRSALDHAVWELVVRNKGVAPKIPSKNQFPIFQTEIGHRSFDTTGTQLMLAGVSSGAIDLIRTEQPFCTGEKLECPLWHLQELSNADKHRTIHVTGTMVSEYKFTMPPLLEPIRDIREFARRPTGPIQQNAILWEGRVIGGKLSYPWAQGDVTGHLAQDIAFDKATPSVGGWIAMATLANILSRVDRVLSRIATEIFSISEPVAGPPYRPDLGD